MDAKQLRLEYGANRNKGLVYWKIYGPYGCVWPTKKEVERMFKLLHPSGGLTIEDRWDGTGLKKQHQSILGFTMPSGLRKEVRDAFVALVAGVTTQR
jgi:hypothetical protein